MKTAELLHHGLRPAIVAEWSRLQHDQLLPVQEAAVTDFDLFRGGNLLVHAPTGSGKTFIGEMAAVHAACRGRKVVYAVPLRSLAEEKFELFRERYDEHGLKVVIGTRDHREYERALRRGDFSVAVVVYEMAEQLSRERSADASPDLVIADEIDILHDPERGLGIDTYLTRMLREGVRVVGLSASLPDAAGMADWMGAELLSAAGRPADLRYGVLRNGRFRYRTHNAGEHGEETIGADTLDSWWDVVDGCVQGFARRGEQSVVFVKTKFEAMRAAQFLARGLDSSGPDVELERLYDGPATKANAVLLETMPSGVAFHSSDLLPSERSVVERAFRQGALKVVVATSTLATGLNLPAHNVFIAPEKWRYDSRFRMPWKGPVTLAEYRNMSGRAGRNTNTLDCGRSILIAESADEERRLMERYVQGCAEQEIETGKDEGIDVALLRMVADGDVRDFESAVDSLNQTYHGRSIWARKRTADEIERDARSALNRLVDAGAVAHTITNRLEPTPFGDAIARAGVRLETALAIERWIREAEVSAWNELDLFLASLDTFDGQLSQVSLSAQEYESGSYFEQLREFGFEHDDVAAYGPDPLAGSHDIPDFETVRAAKVALILMRALNGMPVEDIEARCQTMAGQVLTAREQVAWLVETAASLADASGACPDFVRRLRAIALELRLDPIAEMAVESTVAERRANAA